MTLISVIASAKCRCVAKFIWPAASALVQMQTILGQCSDIGYDQRRLSVAFAKCQSAIAKTHIVGSQDTVGAVMRYTSAAGAAFLELISRRALLLIRKCAIETHANLMDQALQEKKRLGRMLQQYNIDRLDDPERFKAIQRQVDFASERWDAQNAKFSRFSDSQLKEQLRLADRFELNHSIAPLLPAAVLAVRNELELALDPNWYEAQWIAQMELVKAAWARSKEHLAVAQKNWEIEQD